MSTLSVSEVFGPTFQGEGPSLGHRCGFIRLGLCNLDCAWCDTPYTWDWTGHNGKKFDRKTELRRATSDELVNRIERMDVSLAVISGGEPMVQRAALTDLCVGLVASGHRVEIETNGTILPPEWLRRHCWFNVSPKLPHARTTVDPIDPAVLNELSKDGRAIFKFVVCEERDLDDAGAIVERCRIPDRAVWVMPEGRDPGVVGKRTEALAAAVLERGWNLTTRLHVMVWGDRRGV